MAPASIIALYVLAALGMVLLIQVMVFFAGTSKATTRADWQAPIPAELLKVLVLHGQWLYIMSNLVGIPWPATLMYPL